MVQDGLFGVSNAKTLTPWHYSAAATIGYAFNPVVLRYDDNSYDPLISHQTAMDLTFAMGVFPFIDVGIDLPIILRQSGPVDPLLGSFSGSSMGDIRLLPRIQIADGDILGLSAAVVTEVAFPTGNDGLFVGEESIAFRPHLIASLPLGSLEVIGSFGYNMRKNTAIADVVLADEFEWHLGGIFEIPGLGYPISVIGEVSGATAAAGPFSAAGLSSLEVIGGGRIQIGHLLVGAGFGVGVTQGVGTPAIRSLITVAYAPWAGDLDHDGLPDDVDVCPREPEDFDGFKDRDGCPEPDNDEDGISDAEDQCPEAPEDYNDFFDDDGCPDGEGLDRDGDGLPDEVDRCPTQPEDVDGVRDTDGCPDTDNDFDGVPDETDECPDERETINGIEDNDGCADEGEGATVYTESKIELRHTILFQSGKAILKKESLPILDQVALQILAHPEIQSVRIEGHTDALGPEEDNLFLSQDRADSVKRYLIERGIEAERLEAIGFGESKPIASNDNREGRGKNRRVEFVIRMRQEGDIQEDTGEDAFREEDVVERKVITDSPKFEPSDEDTDDSSGDDIEIDIDIDLEIN